MLLSNAQVSDISRFKSLVFSYFSQDFRNSGMSLAYTYFICCSPWKYFCVNQWYRMANVVMLPNIYGDSKVEKGVRGWMCLCRTCFSICSGYYDYLKGSLEAVSYKRG